MKHRPTIKDIAAEAGVSHTTVSYILRGNTTQKISLETRTAVMEAAKRLQYVPNCTARSLRNNSTHCVSVAMEKSITSARFSGILQGIRSGLQAEGYSLMLFDFNTNGAVYPDFLESVLQRRTDGIIFVSSDGNPPNEEWSNVIVKNKLPFVACDCCPEDPELNSVSFDYEGGAYAMACRLFCEGAKRLLYWRPETSSPQEFYRERGLRRAAELYPDAELSIVLLPDHLVNENHYGDIIRICKQQLAQEIMPKIASFQHNDAVICCWNVMASHLHLSLNSLGRDLRIATLSDSELAMMGGPHILSSRPNFFLGGKECTRLLLRQIQDIRDKESIVIAPDIPDYLNNYMFNEAACR